MYRVPSYALSRVVQREESDCSVGATSLFAGKAPGSRVGGKEMGQGWQGVVERGGHERVRHDAGVHVGDVS